MTKHRHLNVLLLCVLLAPCAARAQAPNAAARAADSRVRLNTVGYLPDYPKRASVPAKFKEFSVVDLSGKARAVLRGRAQGPFHNEDTDEDLYVADFSALKQPGTYRLEVEGVGSSPAFRVAADVYDAPFRAAVQAMYLWRCGAAVSATHDGVTYAHAACHMEDAWLDYVGGGHARRDSTGGWHDAGDYNKYVSNAGVTVGLMLLAWQQCGAQIQGAGLDAHGARGSLPPYLGEVKWETDWLLKMQASDGSVYHKVSTRDFGAAILPEDEKAERYFTPWSSTATADFAAVLASASRAFRPYDRAYADRCLEAARRAYDFLRAHPEDHRADLRGFNTGGYQSQDADERLWAAAELWETTGEAEYLSDFEKRAGEITGAKFDADWGWADVKNLGLLTYIFSKREGRDEEMSRDVREALVYVADKLVERRDAHGYARTLGTRYYWGANGGVANTVVLLRSADMLEPKRVYVEAALDAVSHLLGRNYYGRSFVTGVGFNPPQHTHHRPSMRPGNKDTWPGYLVGGGWPRATDWADVSENYRVNEVAINWNAPLVYALAGFLSKR